MRSEPADPTLPVRLRAFHERLPLGGNPPNTLLALPDDRLLYLAAVLRDEPQPAPALALDEWREFRGILEPHGVFPLLAYRLRAWPEGCRPPAEVMDWLKRFSLGAAARTMRVGRQIQTAVDALEAAGIPSVLLKGPALARTIYPHPALRQSGDIDLLVRPDDVIAAEGVLEGIGYHCSAKGFVVSQHQYIHDTFEPPEEGMDIELHWALDSAFDLFPRDLVDQVIARRVPVGATDLTCHTLSHTDHLLFLAYHNVFQHDSISLDRISDTAGLIATLHDPSEWKDIIDRAVEYHLRIPLELLTSAAALWTGATIPGHYGDPSAWPAPSTREIRLWKHARARHTHLSSHLYLVIHGQPGMVEKVRYGCRFILPPVSMMASYRRCDSLLDIPLAHLRRWLSIAKFI